MPPQYPNLSSPGFAAVDAIEAILTEREAKKRQAMLDEITRSTAARQDEVARAQLELQREQMQGLREQREAAAELNRQKRAAGVIGMLQPGAELDADTTDVLRAGGYGALVAQGAPTATAVSPEAPFTGAPGDIPSRRAVETVSSPASFRGTPQQQALQRFIDDPNTSEPQRAFMRARLAAGDENLPYQLFQDPDTSPDGANWQRFEGRRTPTSSPEFFQQHPKTGEIRDMRGNVVENAVPVAGSAPITSAQASRIERRVQQFDNSAAAKNASELLGHWDRVAGIDVNAGGPEGAAQDAMLIYTYAKAMDPASAVREGEYDTVQAWATNRKDTFFLNAIRILETAPLLTAPARQAIRDRIGEVANAAVGRYNRELPKLNGDLQRIYGPFDAETWREELPMPFERRGDRRTPSVAAPSAPAAPAPAPRIYYDADGNPVTR